MLCLIACSLLIQEQNVLALSQKAQISIEVTKLKSSMSSGDYKAALKSINALRSLNIDLGTEILFYEGKALFETGNYVKAHKLISEYIEAENVDNYDAAINLYIKLEEKIEYVKKKKVQQADLERKKEQKDAQMRVDFKNIYPLMAKALNSLCLAPIDWTSSSKASDSRYYYKYHILDIVNCFSNGTLGIVSLEVRGFGPAVHYKTHYHESVNVVDLYVTKYKKHHPYHSFAIKVFGSPTTLGKKDVSLDIDGRGVPAYRGKRHRNADTINARSVKSGYSIYKIKLEQLDINQRERILQIKSDIEHLEQAVDNFKKKYGGSGLRQMLSTVSSEKIHAQSSKLLDIYKIGDFKALPYYEKIPAPHK